MKHLRYLRRHAERERERELTHHELKLDVRLVRVVHEMPQRGRVPGQCRMRNVDSGVGCAVFIFILTTKHILSRPRVPVENTIDES